MQASECDRRSRRRTPSGQRPRTFDAGVLESEDGAPPALEREIVPWDLQSIIFTSGTTGPSKGVLSSYVHLYNMAIAAPFLSGDDRYMLNLPLFHSGGVMPTTAMLIHGGSVAMVDAFDTDTFWDTVRSRRHHDLDPARRDGRLLAQAAAGHGRQSRMPALLHLCATQRDGATIPRTVRNRDLYAFQHDRDFAGRLSRRPTRPRWAAPASRARAWKFASSTKTIVKWSSARSASSW